MPIGPGKYDDVCTKVREETEAEGVLLIVLNGKNGQGFSVQAPLGIALSIPGILRLVADDVEKAIREGTL